MSESEPSGCLIRYIPGHFESGMIRGSSLVGLRLSVTLSGLCPADIPIDVVTLRTASVARLGRVTAVLIGIPRSRARCETFRQRGLQKRAVERCGLNGEPQAGHVALMMAPIRRHQRGRRAIFDAMRTTARRLSWQAGVDSRACGMSIARIARLPSQSRLRPKPDQRFGHHW